MKYKKQIALVLIYLVVTISFALYTPKEVAAQQQGCCQLTKAGEYCQFTDVNNCNTQFAPFTHCDNTDFCQPICCADNSDGACYTSVSKATCLSKPDATVHSDPTCEIPQCNLGCCKISNQCSLATELQCKSTASQFPGVQMQFDPAVSSEADCVDKCRGEEKGACVSGRSCTFTTRSQCSGTFNINMLCSNPTLNTDCAKQQTTGCFNGDVYWYDSCGNPENIYSSNKQFSYNNGFILAENKYSLANPNDVDNGNCDYISGTICGEAKQAKPKYGDYICKDLNCYDVYENDASPNSGGDKKHGESWCVYESEVDGKASVGPGKDVVGSRHYISKCLNGEEIMTPCKDYREEICVQNKVGEEEIAPSLLETLFGKADYVQAACIENKADECLPCNDLEDCADPECSKKTGLEKQICCRALCCESPEKTCYWMGTSALPDRGGLCVPLVANGEKFWEADSTSCTDITKYLTCTAKVKRGALENDYKCIQNCQCEKPVGEVTIKHHQMSPDWIESMNILCRAQSDCGAWFNVQEEATFGGYSLSGRGSSYELSETDLKKWPTLIPVNPEFKSFMTNWFIVLLHTTGITFTGAMIYQWIAAQTRGWTIMSGLGGWVESHPVLSKILGVGGTLYFIIYFIDLIWGHRERDNTFTFSCLPWEPPAKGDCEKCTEGEEDGFECSEYKCKSLGKNCKFIEEDDRITCTAVTSYDLTPPQITPMPLEGYSITETATGFKINEKIKAFTPLEIGIKTDEPATCKYDLKANTDYNDMPALFGLSNTHEHKISLSLPSELASEEALQLTNGGRYVLYLKCKDYSEHENINSADYAVSFEIDSGPDLNPPSIDKFSILPDSMIPFNAKELDLTIYLNEPSTCKWSKLDKAYNEMDKSFACANMSLETSSIYYNLYECKTKLTEIQQSTLNTFYFRCQDLENNIMQQSYIYKLLSTIPLKISSTAPSGEVFTKNPVLKVRTDSGAENGIATCAYSDKDVMIENMIQMFNTNSLESSQQLRMMLPNTYTIYFKCIDKAGNLASDKTTFTIIAAEEASFIYNIYKDKASSTIHVSTTEDADCQYSSKQFAYGLGTPMATAGKTHTAPLGYPIYYIICQDKFNNQASIVVTP